MRKIYRKYKFISIALTLINFTARNSFAQTNLYISGTKTWDASTANWGLSSGASGNSWINGNYATLELSPAITISGFNPRVYNLNCTSSGSLSGGTQILYLSGSSTPSISVSSGQIFTLNSILGSGLGFIKTSAGTLTLGQLSNRFHGTVTLSGGTLNFPNAANIAAATLRHNVINLSAGTTLTYGGSTNINNIQIGTITGAGTISTTGSTSNGIYSFGTQAGSSSATISTGSTGTITFQGIGGSIQTLTGNTIGCNNLVLCGTRLADSSYTNNLTLTAASTTFTANAANAIFIKGGKLTIDNTAANITAFSTAATAGLINMTGSGGLYIKGNTTGTTLQIGNTTTGSNEHAVYSNCGVNNITVETPAGAAGRTTLIIGGTSATFVSGTNGPWLRDQTYMAINFIGVGGSGGGLGGSGALDPWIKYTGVTPVINSAGLFSGSGSSGGSNQTIGFAVVNGNNWATYGANGVTALTNLTGINTKTALQGLTNGQSADFTPTINQTLSADVTAAAIRIIPKANNLSLICGTFGITCNAYMLQGSKSFTITGTTGNFTNTSGNGTRNIWITDSTASLTIGMIVNTGTNPLNKMGPGFLVFNGSFSSPGQVNGGGTVNRFNIMQGTVRLGNTQLLIDGSDYNATAGASTASNISISFKGGVLEITGGTNGTGASADFKRVLGINTVNGTVYWDNGASETGSGGFSAFGVPASVNIGVGAAGGVTPAQLVWGSTANFIANGYNLIFGSTQSDNRLTFLNPIGLDNGTAGTYHAREIYVYDNTSSANDKTQLAGVISGSANADLIKTGPGELELNAANTYAGNTIIQAGTLTTLTAGALPSTTHLILLGGVLKLTATATVTDLTLNTGATLNLNGNVINVSGDFTYNGGTISGTGTVFFNGSSQQYINGQAVTFSGGVTINNTKGVVMANNVTVTNALALTNGTFSINGNTLTLNGTYSSGASNAGSLTGSATSSVVVGSSATSVPLTFTYDASKVNNSLLSLTVNAAASLDNNTTSSSLYIVGGTSTTPGNITVTGSAIFTTHDSLTLQSNAGGTARVGPNNTITNYITGNVTIERYLESHRAWRLLTGPISTSQSINASWQEGNITTVPTSPAYTLSGFGTSITNTIATNPGTTGFDQAVTNNPSILYLNAAGTSWLVPTATNGTTATTGNVSAGSGTGQEGYMLFIRGDRSVIVKTPPFAAPTSTTLRTRGTLKMSTKIYSTATSGFKVVGNPYASEISLDQIFSNYSTKIGSTYYLWDPLLATGQGVGAFYTITKSGASYAATTHTTTTDIPGRVESGAAFVLNFSVGASILIIETDKTTSAPLVMRPFDQAIVDQSFRADLYSVNSDGSTDLDDGTLTLYDNQYSDSVNWLEDAKKIGNPAENLALERDGQLLAIEKRQPISVTDTIFLKITGMKQQQPYQFRFAAENLVQPGLIARLEDKYLNTSTPVSLTDTAKINFTVTSDAASQGGNRFRIVFQTAGAGPLPVTFTSVKASQQNNNDIAIQWNVTNQLNIKQYEVEKSTDGITFVKVNTTTALVTGSSSINYNWVDSKAVTGDNYYRIVSVSTNGTLSYSQVVRVKIGSNVALIEVYPNPVTAGIIGLQFTNMPKGVYNVRLLNNTGQEIINRILNHNGGSSTQTIPVNQFLAKGVYRLQIVKPDGAVTCISVSYQ